MKPREMAVESVDIDTLKPHPDNPRNGDVDAIAESLNTNGQYKPIVVAKDGTVLAGNHTYAAAMQLSWPTLQVVRLPIAPGSKEARRIMLADNRTSDLGRYDEAHLLEVLQDGFSDDLLGTGYTTADLEALSHLWDDPLDLDDLADIHGDPTPDDGLTRLVLRVESATAAEWRARHEGSDDALLASLLGL